MAIWVHPGNIDLRYNFPLNGGTDIVGFNVREADRRIELYAIDRSTRRISQIDDGSIKAIGKTYGFLLCVQDGGGRKARVSVLVKRVLGSRCGGRG